MQTNDVEKPIESETDTEYFSKDAEYLDKLAESIECFLYEDYYIETNCWSDGKSIFIDYDEDQDEVVIEDDDFKELTGDVDKDGRFFAERFYNDFEYHEDE